MKNKKLQINGNIQKKTMMLVICLIIFLILVNTVSASECGDVDGNGVVNSNDHNLILDSLVSLADDNSNSIADRLEDTDSDGVSNALENLAGRDLLLAEVDCSGSATSVLDSGNSGDDTGGDIFDAFFTHRLAIGLTAFLNGGEYDSNGLIDNCVDTDNDGYGLNNDPSCTNSGTDCNDNDAAINPGAAETCDNLDNDCDSTIDNFATSCGVGECTSTGTCTAGSDSCTPGSPTAEVCDSKDNDCDGTVDGFSTSCGLGECASTGTCAGGVDSCTAGTPTAETCDNLDNDCDGTVDGFSQSCYTGPGGTEGVGVCTAGTETCTAGSFGPCVGDVTPSAENCIDGLYNDCDTFVDCADTVDCPDFSPCDLFGGSCSGGVCAPLVGG